MIFNAKSEPAVSPVIGTILLVAIAVILVAIILVVVMGFSGDTNEKKVGLNAKSESGANATLILYGGASIDELVKLEMIDQGSANGTYVPLWEKTSDNDGTAFVGLPYLAEGVARPLESMAVYDTRINVRGTFSDGTEVILLVQPMTFYDVGGISSSRDEDPYGFSVGSPSASNIQYESAKITVTYVNASSKPTSATIYYRRANTSDAWAPVTETSINGDTDGSISATLSGILRGQKYEVYGEATTTEYGKKQGNSGTFTTIPPTVSTPGSGGYWGNAIKVSVSYRDADEAPAETYIYYQIQGTQDEQFVPFGIGTVDTGSMSDIIDGLKSGTMYEFWGVIIMSDGRRFEGPIMEKSTGETTVNLAGANGRWDTQLLIRIGYSQADSIPDKVYVHYQEKGTSNEVVVEGALDPDYASNIPGGFIVQTITGLKPGTTYEVWGRIVMSDGREFIGATKSDIITW